MNVIAEQKTLPLRTHMSDLCPSSSYADIYGGGGGFVLMGCITAIYWIFSYTSIVSVMNVKVTVDAWEMISCDNI